MSIIVNGTAGISNATWTTATRPAAPVAGQTGFNTDIGAMETYTGSAWSTSDLPAPSTSGNFLQSTGTAWTSATTLGVANGGTGSTSLTANSVLLGNGTSALSSNLVAPSTNGNVLTSNGTTWTSAALPASGGLTLLGTITTTSGNSVSLGSLNLSGYKYIYNVFNGVASNTSGPDCFISSTNVNSTMGIAASFSNTIGQLNYGCQIWDLTSGGMLFQGWANVANSSTYSAVRTNVNTSTTTIYFRLSSTAAFTAGSIIVYGGK